MGDSKNSNTIQCLGNDELPKPPRNQFLHLPFEILALIFGYLDTSTLVGSVPNVCKDWRTLCADPLCGPKVRLKLYSVQQVLQIRPEKLKEWMKAMFRYFAHVCVLDSKMYSLTDSELESFECRPRITNLDLGYCENLTDTGLVHVAQLTQLTFLNLSGYEISNIGLIYIS